MSIQTESATLMLPGCFQRTIPYLETLPEVEETSTYHPLTHIQLITLIESKIQTLDGYELVPYTWNAPIEELKPEDQVNEEGVNRFKTITQDFAIGTNRAGTTLFGIAQLRATNAQNPHQHLAVGFRNSTNKQFAVGFTCGVKTLICSNLCMSGDFVGYAKHVHKVDWNDLIDQAFEAVPLRYADLTEKIEGLREKKFTDFDSAKAFTLDGVLNKAIPPNMVQDVWKYYIEPTHEEFASDGWTQYRLLQALTEAYKKENSVSQYLQQTISMNRMFGFMPKEM